METTRKRKKVIRRGSFMSLYLVAYHLSTISLTFLKLWEFTHVIGIEAKMLTKLKLSWRLDIDHELFSNPRLRTI